MAMKPCKKCKGRNWNYVFMDDTREITATCKKCGNVIKWKAKPRKEITIEMLTQEPVMAVFKYGKLTRPTAKEKAEVIAFKINRAIELGLLK
jgi:uncharacterized Zn finger protein